MFKKAFKTVLLNKKALFLTAPILLGSPFLINSFKAKEYHVKQEDLPKIEKPKWKEAGEYIKGLKEYTLEEIKTHNSKEKRIWVTFRLGVYDITDFVEIHPGNFKFLKN